MGVGVGCVCVGGGRKLIKTRSISSAGLPTQTASVLSFFFKFRRGFFWRRFDFGREDKGPTKFPHLGAKVSELVFTPFSPILHQPD